MALSFDPISSSAEGKRDVAVDFAGALEASETLDQAQLTAESSHPALLEVTEVYVNTEEITKDEGGVILIGKGVTMQLITKQNTRRRRLWVDVRIVGTSNTQETYQIGVPLQDYLRT